MIMTLNDKITQGDEIPPNPLLEEYKVKWDYYKETHKNRKNLFDWYFKIVTIPASAFGVANIISGDKTKTTFSVQDYRYVFLLIFLCGIGLFAAYVIETGISQMYINRIKSLENLLFFRNHKNSKFHTITSVGFWRVMPIIFINSFLLALSISFFRGFGIGCSTLTFVSSGILHYLVYKPIHTFGETRNNIVIDADC
ncbi:hypothetical protein SAMN04488132_10134 [Sediminibacterium ginsengisoli]|uniref:Uncharacterized protein n=1 Tax=Sediminibacterium ginsengisoli TaxID=413434 RepID=A0A1T4JPK6_9BACT|nr:hypothetical protein SAMN04488132_10134 [Sediminibacterium ginsengisoli]